MNNISKYKTLQRLCLRLTQSIISGFVKFIGSVITGFEFLCRAMNDQKENFLRGFESFSQSVKLFCSDSCGSERRHEIKEQLNIVMKELQNVLVEMDFVANNISLLVTHIEVLTDKLDIDCKRFTSNDEDVEPVFAGINTSCSNCRRHHHHLHNDDNCEGVSTHRLGQTLMSRAPMSRVPMSRAPMS